MLAKQYIRSLVLFICHCLYHGESAAQYCVPAYATGNCYKYIDDFILWNTATKYLIDTATGCSVRSHDDRTMLFPPIELVQNTTYYGMVVSSSYTTMKIWIDFKDDGIFHPADSVSPTFITSYNSTVFSYYINIPPNADTGVHRMRVRTYSLGINGNVLNIDPCAMQGSGESHDYRVRIVRPPANDVGVYKIEDIKKVKYPHADSIFCIGRPILFKVVVKNYGSNPQSNFDVQFDFTGAAVGTQITRYTGTIPPMSQDTMTIAFAPQTPGAYALTFYTGLPTDTDPRNDPAQIDIHVEAAPQRLLRDTALCSDRFPIALDAGNAGCSYEWNVYSDARYILASKPGRYTVNIINKYDCLTVDTAYIQNHPLPSISGINITGYGNSFMFNAGNPRNVSSFFWELGNGDTAHTDTVHYTYGAPGTYKVRLVAYNDCGTDTANFNIIVFPTDLYSPAIDSKDIALYPNPVSDVAHIRTPSGIDIKQLLVIDSKGRIIYDTKPSGFNTKYTMDVKGILSGNYVLVIRSSKGDLYKMFSVIER